MIPMAVAATGRDEHGHSGLVQPSGKAVKRAYSMVSPEAEQGRFQIAVKHLIPAANPLPSGSTP